MFAKSHQKFILEDIQVQAELPVHQLHNFIVLLVAHLGALEVYCHAAGRLINTLGRARTLLDVYVDLFQVSRDDSLEYVYGLLAFLHAQISALYLESILN